MARTERYLEGLTIHKVPFNVTNTPAFKEAVNNAADNELFIITDTPTFSLKIGSVTYDGTSNDVLIAPNTYINRDVPDHSVVFGNPCIIKHVDNATKDYVNHIAQI